MFVAGALERERPFLAPPRSAVRRVSPVAVSHTPISCKRYLKRGTTNAVLGLRHPIVHRGSTRKLAKNVLEQAGGSRHAMMKDV